MAILRDLYQKTVQLFSAAQLPTAPAPKAKPKPSSLASFKTQVSPLTSRITKLDKRLASTDIVSFRNGATTSDTIRNLAASSPDLSSVVNSYLRTAITDKHTMVARNMDGTVNPEATQLAQELLRRFTYTPDYSLGFNTFGSLQSLSESLGKELLLEGAASLELVLDKARLPSRIVPVSVKQLFFYEEDNGVRPVQVVGGQEIDLDQPTFIYTSVDQSLLSAYPSSMFEAAIQPILADSEFLNDLRRSMQRTIQPRLVVSIIEEQVKRSVSPDLLNDPVAYAAFMNSLISGLTQTINGLEPSDALVGFDSVEYTYLTSEGPGNVGDTLKAVQSLLNAKLTTGAKALPVMLGHASTGNASSTEALLFAKSANIVRVKLNELYSRAFTLAVRIMGQDVYVDFAYAPIDLRPQAELEAYRVMEQSRILELLSLGMLDDSEACVMLTGNLPPVGYIPLSGTQFKSGGVQIAANPASQTSNLGDNKPVAPDSKPAKPSGRQTTPTAPKSK